MSRGLADLRRIASQSGLYALASVCQRGLAFLLLPIYTRYLNQSEYGVLELLAAMSGILFGALLLGLPSAVTKVFHRDCQDDDDRRRLLWTAVLLDLPILVVFGGALLLSAESLGIWVTGEAGNGSLVQMVVLTALVSSLMAIVLASFRARERAVAFAVLTLAQFVPAMLLNILFVVRFDMGVRGVLWGNLLSNLIALPLAFLWAARGGELSFGFARRLVRPLLAFGLPLVPAMLAGWVLNVSDRYVLRLFTDLEEIAIYGVGYKIGMVLQMAIVWPFQLAWPAVSFSISRREGHRESYAQVLSWLALTLAVGVVGLSLLARAALPWLAGEAYSESYRVVPLVALAYALNGICYCVAPGIHLTGRTRWLPVFIAAAAALNLGLNFLWVPRYGMMGATWATFAAMLLQAILTFGLSQRMYAVPWEVSRLIKVLLAAFLVYFAATAWQPAELVPRVAWAIGLAAVVLPLLVAGLGFLDRGERAAIVAAARRWWRRKNEP